jgi:hypothetical protein
MKKRIPLFIFKAKNLARHNKSASTVISAGYKLLISAYFKAFINILFTALFTIQFEITDFSKYRWFNWQFYTSKWYIWLTSIVMLIFNWFVIIADNYLKREQEKMLCQKEIIARQTLINYKIGSKLFELTENISNPVSYIPIKNDFVILTYQDVAALVCHNIYDAIKNSTGEDGHQVSIMFKFKESDSGKEFIKMIAYGNANQVSPGVFNTKFYLDDKERFYHVKIFEENTSNIFILKNKSEINVNFIESKKSKKRDAKIQQYIGIPVFCEETGIIALLQIDTNIENLFGKTNNEIEDFFSPFMSYIHILKVNYYMDELLRLLSKKFDILSKRIDELKIKAGRRHNYEQRQSTQNSPTGRV